MLFLLQYASVILPCWRTLHERLTALNPGFADRHAEVHTRPDGDVELDDTGDFVVPDCDDCGGVLKPDVVFFGENVPAPRVQRCYDAVDDLPDRGGALLVAGSSLAVMSGLRFVKRAARAGTPVVIVNRGATRGDEAADVRVDAGCSQTLTAILAALTHGVDTSDDQVASRANTLRAGVLGANDGIVSVAAIVVGVAGEHDHRPTHRLGQRNHAAHHLAVEALGVEVALPRHDDIGRLDPLELGQQGALGRILEALGGDGRQRAPVGGADQAVGPLEGVGHQAEALGAHRGGEVGEGGAHVGRAVGVEQSRLHEVVAVPLV